MVAVTEGQTIIGVGRVSRINKLSEVSIDDFDTYRERIALKLSPSFWKTENDRWPPYDGQGKQFHQARHDYIDRITQLFYEQQGIQMIGTLGTLLNANKQIILTGAPGTGKTYLARQLAATLVNCGENELKAPRFDFVQFHPSYDYTDFVEGLKPRLDSQGQMTFEVRPGIFMKFCDEAKKQEGPCVFVIDEINRADLSRVFGELFYALEPGYRGEAGSVSTQYASQRANSGERFHVPKNVFIIGTMNDIDRSVESIDFALRRRFAWYEVKADEERWNAVAAGAIPEEIKGEARERYHRLNKAIEIADGLNKSFHIGPAYYRNLKAYVGDDKVWETFWARHLEPLLREYVRGMANADDLVAGFERAYESGIAK